MANPTYTAVRPLPEHREATKAFLAALQPASRREGWTEAQTFTRWLDAASSCLLSPGLRTTNRTEALARSEDRYMRIVKGCRGDASATMNDLAKALAVVVQALHTPTDFLGPIFAELAADARGGQFFTPWHVSSMIARMTLIDAPAMLDSIKAAGGNRIMASEPACGVGGMVMAANEVLREQGLEPALSIHWQCVDTDWRACAAAYIQLSLTGCSAAVVHGNALSLEQWEVMPTITALVFPPRRAPAAPIEPPPVLLTAAEPPPAKAKAGQLDFGF